MLGHAGQAIRESQVCERFNWAVHSYCQIGKHDHMLVDAPGGNLAKGTRQFYGGGDLRTRLAGDEWDAGCFR